MTRVEKEWVIENEKVTYQAFLRSEGIKASGFWKNRGDTSTQKWDRVQVCQSVQDGGQSLKWPGIRDQYPRDIAKPTGLKNDANSTRSIELNSSFAWLRYFTTHTRTLCQNAFLFKFVFSLKNKATIGKISLTIEATNSSLNVAKWRHHANGIWTSIYKRLPDKRSHLACCNNTEIDEKIVTRIWTNSCVSFLCAASKTSTKHWKTGFKSWRQLKGNMDLIKTTEHDAYKFWNYVSFQLKKKARNKDTHSPKTKIIVMYSWPSTSQVILNNFAGLYKISNKEIFSHAWREQRKQATINDPTENLIQTHNTRSTRSPRAFLWASRIDSSKFLST